EATEVYNYWSCVQSEGNARIKKIWERFLDYELGQLQHVAELFARYEKRDPAENIPEKLPDPIDYVAHRDFVRDVLRNEVNLSSRGTEYVPRTEESPETRAYRDTLNSEGSPTDTVAADYVWTPGTELNVLAGGSLQMPE